MHDRFTIHPFVPSHPHANRKHIIIRNLTYRNANDDSQVILPANTRIVEIGVVMDAEDPTHVTCMAAEVGGEVYPVPYEMTICLEYR